jgi:hypothetical protein
MDVRGDEATAEQAERMTKEAVIGCACGKSAAVETVGVVIVMNRNGITTDIVPA